MLNRACWRCLVFMPLMVLLITLVSNPTSRGDVPTNAFAPALIEDKVIPEPPRQHHKWKPPPSKVPTEFVAAADLLFEQGLADPRGCHYCEFEIRTSSSNRADDGITRTHGWVLPAKEGDKRRFAVCWNGLVYPIESVTGKANLQDDVKEATTDRKATGRYQRRQYRGDYAVSYEAIGDLGTAMLLRLGEGELAFAVWTNNHPPPEVGNAAGRQDKEVPYLSLLEVFARSQFKFGKAAHVAGDDVLALHAFRKLTAFAQRAEVEARLDGFKPTNDRPKYLHVLNELPVLLADQERRANEGARPAVVCVGPGRDPDANKRIAALIARLDEVDFQRGEFSFMREGDPIVQALIREGPPALEPLLKCFEEDRRLSRSFCTSRHDWDGIGKTFDVHDWAKEAFEQIYRTAYFDPSAERQDRGPLEEQIAALRDKIKRAEWLSSAEWKLRYAQDCWKELSDDSTTPEKWSLCARRLVEPPPEMEKTATTAVWPNLRVKRWMRRQEERPIAGELLRNKKGPSVTELLLKRIQESDDDDATSRLVLALADWEPKAALAPMAQLTPRLRSLRQWEEYVLIVTKRHELGDGKALEDYIAWIRAFNPDMGENTKESWSEYIFSPMWRYDSYPGMAAAAEKVFCDEKSAWLPLVEPGRRKTQSFYHLTSGNLFRVPAFQKAVLNELTNKCELGTIDADPSGSTHMQLPWCGVGKGSSGIRDFDIPENGAKETFRICDYLGDEIGSHFPGAPPCELYWPEKKRDKALLECAEYLQNHGTPLFLSEPEVFKHEKPASLADVQAGKAIFSLAGEAEARLVQGLSLPQRARWVTLKHRPYLTEQTDPRTGKTIVATEYRQDGHVVQAEEVFKDGKWSRYYGFVGSNHTTRVPAEEIEFPAEAQGWREPWQSTRLTDGFHARLNVPPLTVELIDGFPPRVPGDAALIFGLSVRNARGVDQSSPAPDKSIRLRLLYSPEAISRKGALVPEASREAEWKQMILKPGAAFKSEKAKILAPTEEMTVATFDLRELYDLSKPGFYRLQLLSAAKDPLAAETPPEVTFSQAPLEAQLQTAK